MALITIAISTPIAVSFVIISLTIDVLLAAMERLLGVKNHVSNGFPPTARSSHHRFSETEKPSIIDYMWSLFKAAKEMKKRTDRPLKDLLEVATDRYNDSMKKKRNYLITGEVRSFLFSLARCRTIDIEKLQLHYIQYKHKDAGTQA